MNYFKKKINKLGRKLSIRSSSSQGRRVSFDLDNLKVSTMDIYQPFTPPLKMIRQGLVIKNKARHSEALDDVVLEILGADPSIATVYGKPIQNDLAIRFEFLATTGLTNELRKELLRSHLPPVNCKLIDAPSLNPEIKAVVTDNIIKRDKAIYNKQKQRSCAIACLGEAITLYMSKDNKDPNILKLLMDTGRILCDSQHNDSVTRRNFIFSVLKRDLKDQISNSKIDSMLFGKELPQTLKAAKEIKESSNDMKMLISPVNSNKQKPECSMKNSNRKVECQISQTKRSKSPITDYILEQRSKESPRSSKQSHKVDCWQDDRSIKKSPRESRLSSSSSSQRR